MLLYRFKDAIFFRHHRRIKVFNMAMKKSIETGKQLMVIGDPYTGSYITKMYNKIFGTYSCGDVCVDLTGCPKCSKQTDKIVGNIENILSNYKYNNFVIFVSCVLEYVDDIDFVISELYRVSGGDLYVVFTKNPVSSYHDDAGTFGIKNKIISAPPESGEIRYKRMNV